MLGKQTTRPQLVNRVVRLGAVMGNDSDRFGRASTLNYTTKPFVYIPSYSRIIIPSTSCYYLVFFWMHYIGWTVPRHKPEV